MIGSSRPRGGGTEARSTLPRVLRQPTRRGSVSFRPSTTHRDEGSGPVGVLYGVGLRVAEACGLDVDDVDLDRQSRTVTGRAKATTASIERAGAAALASYLTQARPEL